jgi:hypothetical protein
MIAALGIIPAALTANPWASADSVTAELVVVAVGVPNSILIVVAALSGNGYRNRDRSWRGINADAEIDASPAAIYEAVIVMSAKYFVMTEIRPPAALTPLRRQAHGRNRHGQCSR